MRMMFARAGEECCQPPSPRLWRSRCDNVASLTAKAHGAAAVINANFQLETGNIGIGNTSTMATFSKMFARGIAGAEVL